MKVVWVVICSLILSFGAAVGVNLQKLSMTREEEIARRSSREDGLDDDNDNDDDNDDDNNDDNNNQKEEENEEETERIEDGYVDNIHDLKNDEDISEEVTVQDPDGFSRSAKVKIKDKSKSESKSKSSTNSKRKKGSGRPPYLQPLWCVGLSMIVLDAIGDFVFIGLAPQSLLAPLGSFSLGWNMILAPWFHTNEVVTCSILGATAIIYVGTLLTVLFAATSSPTYNLDTIRGFLRTPQFIIYEIGCAFILIFLGMYKSKYWYPMIESFRICCCGIAPTSTTTYKSNSSLNHQKKRVKNKSRSRSESNSSTSSNSGMMKAGSSSRARYVTTTSNDVDDALIGPDSSVLMDVNESTSHDMSDHLHGSSTTFGVVHYCGTAGCLGGQCILFAKSASELIKNAIITKDLTDWTTSALPYIFIILMIGTVLTQIHYLNQGLKKFDALIVVPVYQSIWNIFGISGGLIFFQEYTDMTSKDATLYTLGIVITLVGVAILVHQRKRYVGTTVVQTEENLISSEGMDKKRTRKQSSTSDEQMQRQRLQEELSLPVVHNEHTTLVEHHLVTTSVPPLRTSGTNDENNVL